MSIIDIRRVDFTLLVVFRELIRTRQTTAVGQRLGLSQSAVSHALSRLRGLFADPLFTRRSQGLEPTEKALALAAPVESILAAMESLLTGGGEFSPHETERAFKIAANDFVASLIAPALQQRLAQLAPRANFSIRFVVGAEALDALRDRTVDVAVGHFGAYPADMTRRRLSDETYRVATRRYHPRIASELSLDDDLELGHVLVSFRGGFRGTVDIALSRLGLCRNVRLSAPMFLTALEIVATSDLAVTAPERLLRKFAPKFGLRLDQPPFAIDPFEISVVTARRTGEDAGLAWFVERLSEIWTSPSA